MKLTIRSVVAGAAALAITGTMVVAAAGVASAAVPTSSPFDPASNGSGNTQGTLTFYDAAGNQITSGPAATAPTYVKANAWSPVLTAAKAQIQAATPVKGNPAGSWSAGAISVATSFPITTGPANLNNLPNALNSQVTRWFGATGWQTLFPNTNSDPAWQGLYQIRMVTSGTGSPANAADYASATIYLDTSNNTWTQVWPTVPTPTTNTALAASPAGPQGPGTSVTLQATVKTPNASGTAVNAGDGKVQFKVNGSDVGTPVAVNASGQASQQVSSDITGAPLVCGTNTVAAVFAPTDSGLLAGSTSTTISSYTIKGTGPAGTCPQKPSFTALTVNPTSGQLPVNVGLTATVYLCPSGTAPTSCTAANGTPAQPGDGQVQFNSSVDGTLGTASIGAGGVASVNQNNPTPNQPITFTATFVPADPSAVTGSSATGQGSYTGQNPCQIDPATGLPGTNNNCVDPQNVRVTVPVGTLAITTPYTANNPFDLGNLSVNPANPAQLVASKAFPGAGQVIQVTDLRAGNLGWTASVSTTDFSSGTGTIDGNGLSLTGLATVNPTTAGGPVQLSDATSFKGAAKQFAKINAASASPAGSSTGTTSMQGTMTLTAPSNTSPGTYNGTVTFTVS